MGELGIQKCNCKMTLVEVVGIDGMSEEMRVSLNPSNVSAGTAPRPGNTKPPPSQSFGLSLVWVWRMDKPRPFQTEGITHGDMEGRDGMAYWELEVIGCE